MSIQNGLVLSKPLTDNTPKIRSSKMGQLRKEIMPRFGNVYSKQWWGVKSRIIDIQPAPTKLELHACWSQSLIFFIGCRESQDADEQGVSFHPSHETRVVLTAGSPTAITHEKKGHIHGKTKPNLQTWVFSKNRGKKPKMDGENNGKPYEQMDDLGGKSPIFGNLHFWTYVPAIKSSGLWFFSTKRSPNPVGFKKPIPIWTLRW